MKFFASFYICQNHQLIIKLCFLFDIPPWVWVCSKCTSWEKGGKEVEKSSTMPFQCRGFWMSLLWQCGWKTVGNCAFQWKSQCGARRVPYSTHHPTPIWELENYFVNIKSNKNQKRLALLGWYCSCWFIKSNIFSLQNVVTNKPRGKIEVLVRGFGDLWLWE